MMHLSSLQKKLSIGLEMFRQVMSRVRPYHPSNETRRQSSSWELSRRKLSEFQSMIENLSRSEVQASEGSPELYWRARARSAERELALSEMQMREAEYLGRAVNQVGQYFESIIPQEALRAFSSCDLDDNALRQHLARASDENLRLLEELSKVEKKMKLSQEQSSVENIAVENAQAMIGLSLFEENFYRGLLANDSSVASETHNHGLATPASFADLSAQIAEFEGRLKELSDDWLIIEEYLSQIAETEMMSDSRVRAELVEQCFQIGRKYVSDAVGASVLQ